MTVTNVGLAARLLIAAVLAGLAWVLVALAAEPPLGRWKTVDEKTGKIVSEVELYDQAGKLFGKIVGLTDPLNAQGKPKVCSACKGEDKDKPIVGLVIIKGLSPDNERYKGGTILDPDDGKVYKAEIWTDEGKLKVRGYLGPFYRTQTWVK